MSGSVRGKEEKGEEVWEKKGEGKCEGVCGGGGDGDGIIKTEKDKEKWRKEEKNLHGRKGNSKEKQ